MRDLHRRIPFRHILFIMVATAVVVLCSCKSLMSPPSVASVEKQFAQNHDDIIFLTEHFVSSGFESVYIHHTSNVLYVDGKHIEIQDENIAQAIENLFKNGCSVIIKSENTIYYQLWTRFTDAGCGIAYSVNKIDAPYIDYLTELVPLKENGWYYYVDDYNEWRANEGQRDRG